ncbi:beta-lactamase family protein [Mesorhizobium australicum]|uniref:serine hydrolase domain-containing protein n=1 Tax=Mesorhizobium australicum TaxID=536018 RepID=UPI0033378798
MKTMNARSEGLAALKQMAVISPTAAASLPPTGFTPCWTPDQQIVGYRSMTKIEPGRLVRRGPHVKLLPIAERQISPHWIWKGRARDVDAYMEAARTSGVIVLKDGQIVLERYGLGRMAKDCWEAQSVTKSVVAILLGSAIQDGYIKNMAALVTEHIPELKGSAYEGVTIRQLVTMTSGVKFNLDYVDPSSDSFKLWSEPFVNGIDPVVAFMRRQPRANQPGARFFYSDPDAALTAILVSNAVGKSMSEYLSEKLWQPCGMEEDAYWIVDPAGNERGGCGISISLRDFARLGQFILGGGKVGGVEVMPRDWLAEATMTQVSLPEPKPWGATGYGYFWWIYRDGYAALGHAGQAIFVCPEDKIVIATNSAWPEPNCDEDWQALDAFVAALHSAAVENR